MFQSFLRQILPSSRRLCLLPFLVTSVFAAEPEYSFTHYAGPVVGGRGWRDGQGPAAQFSGAYGLALDASGNLYVADIGNHTIRKITPTGLVTTFAGSPQQSGSSDGSGNLARFNHPRALCIDLAGNLYVADSGNHTIRKITPAGSVSTLAGSPGQSGDTNGPATSAQFKEPHAIAVDSSGNLYVADTGNRKVRKISTSGEVTTLRDEPGRFSVLTGIAVDTPGNVYVSAFGDRMIYKITPNGDLSEFAGQYLFWGTVDGTGSAARFPDPTGISIDQSGNLLVAEQRGAVRKITPAGVVTTYAATTGFAEEGPLSSVFFGGLSSIAVSPTGAIYLGDFTTNTLIRRISNDGMVTTIASSSALSGTADGVGTAVRFSRIIRGIAVESNGTVYVADSRSNTIRRIAPGGVVSTFAGSAEQSGSADGIGTAARFYGASGIAVSNNGTLYVADSGNHLIRRITPQGVVSTLAGAAGQSGATDGLPATARFNNPQAVTIDARGNIYVADGQNYTIRKITPDGIVSTLAGAAGQSGSTDGVGALARLGFITGIVADPAGNLYATDNHTVRKITPLGEVTTFAGAAGSEGTDDGTGGDARFTLLNGIAIDSTGNLFVTEVFGTVRRITPQAVVTTVGGSGFTGNVDGIGRQAWFGLLRGIGVDGQGNLYLADQQNCAVWKGTVLGARVAPTIAWSYPRAISAGRALSTLQLNATTTIPGTFSYSPALGTVLPVGTHILGVTFTPEDTTTYRTVSSAVTLTVFDPGVTTTRLTAIAARCRAGAGDQTLIMGFVVNGGSGKQALLRGVGPGISTAVPTALTNPHLKLFRHQQGSNDLLDENDDWANGAEMLETFSRLGAASLDANSRDAAILREIPAGVYSAHVGSSGAASGIALVEAYDADPDNPARFAALSTRTVAGTGDDTLIAGFVLEGSGPKSILLRAVGPSLVKAGVPASSILQNPTLKLYRMSGGTNTLIAENDDWSGTAELKDTFTAAGAGALDSDSSKDAALLVTLEPGVYTAHVSSVTTATGIALVEIFEVP